MRLTRSHGNLCIAVLTFMAGALAFTPETDSTALKGMLGIYRGIFVTGRADNMGFDVYTVPDLTKRSLPAESDRAGSPRVSPDGQWLLCALGTDGNILSARSLKVGDNTQNVLGTGYYGNWWVDPATRDTFITWGTVKEDIRTTKYNGHTLRRKFSGGVLVGAVDTVLDQSFRCAISRDGRWIGTVQKTPMFYDLVNNENHVLSTCQYYSGNPTVCDPKGGQACHGYMSPTVDPARMDQMCYFNIWHDTLLIRNSRDETVRGFPFTWIPEAVRTAHGLKKWHAGGWSNYEDLIMTSAQDGSGTFLKILVRLSDSTMLAVGTGSSSHDLWLNGVPRYTPSVVGAPIADRVPAAVRRTPTVTLRVFARQSPVPGMLYDIRGRAVHRAASGARARPGVFLAK